MVGAKGFLQAYDSSYVDTFLPVIKITSLRILISLATTKRWQLHQLIIKNIFLDSTVKEEVYIEQLVGFVIQGEYTRVCKLKRSVYGLKQSPSALFGRIALVLQKFCLICAEKD